MTIPTRYGVFPVALALCAVLAPLRAHAYPEFQTFIESQGGRTVNCAVCHAHPDGPEGPKPGQIGSLKPEELEQLNRARAAFEPGMNLKNPILNDFGNHIINVVGKREFLLLRQNPAGLVKALGPDHDLDGDGVPDAEEFLAGTLPTDPMHGDPWTLFWTNLKRRAFHVVMIALATVLGLYGLNNLLRGFEHLSASPPAGENGN